jgi:hypothetical protein
VADSLLTVVNRVRRVLGLPTVSSFTDNDESNLNVQDVNDSYLYLLKQLPDDLALLDTSGGSITTVADTRLYSLDGDARHFHLLEWSFQDETSGDIPLSLTTREYIQRKDPRFDEVTGKPQFLYRDVTKLGVYPVPDAVYEISYQFKSPFTRLTLTSDTFIIPDEWLRPVELHAIFLYEDRKGFSNAPNTAARMKDELISVVAEAELMNPSYFVPEVFY